MDTFERLKEALSGFSSQQWVEHYFAIVKQLLTDLDITPDDKRLSLTLTKGGSMPVNIGQRYVLRPATDGYVGYIVPIDFDTDAVEGFEVFLFSSKGINDAKFIEVPLKKGGRFPELLYRMCLGESAKILQHCTRSGYRKYHVPLLYDFIMEPSVRQEVLREVSFKQIIT